MGVRCVALTGVLLLLGCGGASGEPLQDEARSNPKEAATDGAGDSVAKRPIEAGAEAGASPGSTWTELYRDLFGPAAPASCAGSGECHGAPEHSGALGSSGYVCASKEGCRASMLAAETGLIQPSDFSAPDRSTLVKILRRRTSNGGMTGSMPKRSPYVFEREAIGRIEAWIRHGAPSD